MTRTLKYLAPAASFAVIALLFAAPGEKNRHIALHKGFLDMPSGEGWATSEEESAPDEILFYGTMYEASGVFFCLDQSMSMGESKWKALQKELARTVNSFSTYVQFGIVFFHEEASVIPTSKRPARATAFEKQSAINAVQAMCPSERSTCFLVGLREALQMANKSTVNERCIIFMSDGKATCVGQDSVSYAERTLRETKALNFLKIPIHTIGIGFQPVEYFLKTLARENGGTYRRLPWISGAGGS
jgi:hypothetical protein